MQILSTINSIIRLKLCTQINLHFKTATCIFLQHIPYRIIDIILQQFFTANFSSRHAHFSTLIKCIQYSLLLIENYSQVIFDNLRNVSTKSVLYTGYIPVSCRKMSADVEA